MNKLKFIIVTLILFNDFLFANIADNKDQKNNIKSILDKSYKTFLINKKVLKDYYQTNNYEFFWIDEKGIKDISLVLLEKIKNDPVLKNSTTKLFKLETIVESLTSLEKEGQSEEEYQNNLIKIDFMMTELYDKYSAYVLNGSVEWKIFEEELKSLDKEKEIKAHWDKYLIVKNRKLLLKNAIENNDLTTIFNEIDFNFPNSDKLVLAIDKLETIVNNGDYTKVPPIKSLRIGDNSETVKFLRKRLFESQDLTKNCEDTIVVEKLVTNNIPDSSINTQEQQSIQEQISCENYFDEDLKNAVISFQKSHGLFADGIVGTRTQKFLNISAKERINQIRLNLERMRWLPRDLGEKYLIVNIPDFRLKMIENNNIKLNMAVVVGERKHPTPIFSDKMSYIVLNPKWNIPDSITKKEIIPKLIKDPNYLVSKGIDIYDGWHPESNKMNTQDIIDAFILEDPNAIANFRLTQSPSNQNPLGRMKFMFPNKHAVYLHDTPAKSLFGNARRAYSHGCIRLSKPQELLATIAQEDKNLNPEKMNEILKESNEKSIGLTKKIPIHLVYLTSWVDEEGILQFREDIYDYDKMQLDLF